MLELKSLSAGYGKVSVIEGIDGVFRPGEITAVIGPNGSGKSTLLKAVVNLCDVHKGEIYLNGRKREETGCREFARQVSYLSQSHSGAAITVSRMVLHGRFPYLTYPRHYGEKDYECCRQAMKRMGILDLKDKMVEELSGGQRQKVYLAMALAGDMEVYLFDEPATYLDVKHQLEVLEVMKQLRSQKKAVVTVLHDLNSALQTADQIMVMDRGRTVFVGNPEQICDGDVIGPVFGVRMKTLQDEAGNRYFMFG